MEKNIMYWSLNRNKFCKISSKDTYRERLGQIYNSVWYLEIRRYDKPSSERGNYEILRGTELFYLHDNFRRYHAYSLWDIRLIMENDLSYKTVEAKVILNTIILEKKNLAFESTTTDNRIGICDTSEIVDYRLDVVLIFPELDESPAASPGETCTIKTEDLPEDLMNLLCKEYMADIKFNLRGITMNAHKSVLSARSPVFKEMFSKPNQEKLAEIEINDIDYDAFCVMMKFIYSSEVEVTSPVLAFELLYAAKKYQLTTLMDKLTQYIEAVLNHENAIEILKLADMYDQTLKDLAIKFISERLDEFRNALLELKSENSSLALEVYATKLQNDHLV